MLFRVMNKVGPPELLDMSDKKAVVLWNADASETDSDVGCEIRVTKLDGNDKCIQLFFELCTHIFVMVNGKTVEKLRPCAQK